MQKQRLRVFLFEHAGVALRGAMGDGFFEILIDRWSARDESLRGSGDDAVGLLFLCR